MNTATLDTTHQASRGRLARATMSLRHCLLLVRHGQTQLNVENRMATHTDVPLTRTGHDQAALLTQSLAGAAFDGAYTSPLRRATATAEAALAQARFAGKPLRDSRLVEPSAGPFEGLAFADLERGGDEELCSAYARYTDETNPVYPSGAEPLERSSGRARAFLTEIEATPGRFFTASHGGFVRILICEFLGLDPRFYIRLKVDNCHAALLKFYPQPPHQLVGLNLAPL